MLEKVKKIFKSYKEVIMYLIFGILTTVVNFIVYMLFAWIFEVNETVSNGIAWLVSVLFAYVTNKIWVFESKSTKFKVLVYELGSFFGCRALSGALDIAMFYVLVELLKINDIITKIIISIFVIILNYVFSKLIIFKAKTNN